MPILKNQKHEVTYNTETQQVIYNERNFNTTPVAERLFKDAGTHGVGPEPSVDPVPSYFTYDIYDDGVHGEGIRLKRFDDSLENLVIASQYSHEGQAYDVKYLYGGHPVPPWEQGTSEPGMLESLTTIKSITIPSSVLVITDGASQGPASASFARNCTSLESVIFEEDSQLIYIGNYAFSNCSGLTSIEIPSTVTSIGGQTFLNCSSLTNIEIPSSVASIGQYAFYNCSSLTSIEIPSSVTSIGEGAFNNCSSLTSIEIPSSVTSIGRNVFYGCSNLTSIDIPSSVTSIDEQAFFGCSSLINILFAEESKLESIGNNAFYDCPIVTATIPAIVGPKIKNNELETAIIISGTSIDINAFTGCSNLSSVVIPASITSIGVAAFYECTSLASITYSGTMSQWSQITLGADWNASVPATVVHCSDGDVTL